MVDNNSTRFNGIVFGSFIGFLKRTCILEKGFCQVFLYIQDSGRMLLMKLFFFLRFGARIVDEDS